MDREARRIIPYQHSIQIVLISSSCQRSRLVSVNFSVQWGKVWACGGGGQLLLLYHSFSRISLATLRKLDAAFSSSFRGHLTCWVSVVVP